MASRTSRILIANSRGRKAKSGFTLVELLVSMVVLILIMGVTIQMLGGVSAAWKSNSGRTVAFAAARASFDALSRNLSQATLNTYLAYADKDGNPVPLVNPSFKHAQAAEMRKRTPTQYLRASELHFITGPAEAILTEAGVSNRPQVRSQAVFFQSPVGFVSKTANRPKESLVNVLGYYIEFGSDEVYQPTLARDKSQPRFRYRLMEVLQPAEMNAIYQSTTELDSSSNLPVYNYDLDWVEALDLGTPGKNNHPLAENILVLAMLPKLSPLQADEDPLSTDYTYDSRAWEESSSALHSRWRNQLPPIMELILICIDEPSAIKMQTLYGGASGSTPPLENGTVEGALRLATKFQDPAKLDDEIAEVEEGLAELGLAYRTFRTDISMHGSKWTNQ